MTQHGGLREDDDEEGRVQQVVALEADQDPSKRVGGNRDRKVDRDQQADDQSSGLELGRYVEDRGEEDRDHDTGDQGDGAGDCKNPERGRRGPSQLVALAQRIELGDLLDRGATEAELEEFKVEASEPTRIQMPNSVFPSDRTSTGVTPTATAISEAA